MPSIYVDVDLSEFSTPDLEEELRLRARSPEIRGVGPIEHMYELYALGKKDELMEYLRTWLQDETGRVLP